MSDERTYNIHVPLREVQTRRHTGLGGRPLPSSVPRAFTVLADTKMPGLVVKMLYQSATDEPTAPFTHGSVTVDVGCYTGRLFSLKIRIDGLDHGNANEIVRHAAKELIPVLRSVFAALREREMRSGVVGNYYMTAAGLELGDDRHDQPPSASVPPWMVDGLQKLREEQSGRRLRGLQSSSILPVLSASLFARN